MKQETKNSFEVFNFFANYVIAIVAIGGFIYSIISSNEASETLDEVKNSLSEFIQPLLVFSEYNWFNFSDEPLSCRNPPNGININYINSSLIPVKILTYSLKVYYDSVLFYDASPKQNEKKDEIILEPKGNMGTSIYSSQFLSLDKTSPSFEPPFLEFHLTAYISNLKGNLFYKVEYIHQIGINCNSYSQRNITAIKQNVTLISQEEI